MTAKAYSVMFFIVLLIMALALCLVNVVVDAQGVFRLVVVDGFNQYVLKNNSLGRVGNGLNLYLNKYDTLLLGTSRVQSGMDPRMDALEGKRVFNGSLGDTEMLEIVAEMEFVLERQTELKEIYFGLDLHSFSANRELHTEFEDSLFNPESSFLMSLFRANFNGRVLEDNVSTVMANVSGMPKKYWVNGHYHSDTHVDHRATIENILTVYMARREMFGCFEYDRSKQDALQAILEKYAEAGIDINLFISPQHAKNLLILEYVNSLDTYYQWMRDMTLMAEAINRDYPDAVKLWNFSGFNHITNEPIVYGREQMDYYFETSHYTDVVGEMVVEVMQNEEPIDDFGGQMTSDTIDGVIQSIRNQSEIYRRAYPEEMADLERVYHNTQDKRSSYSCSASA